MNRLAIGTAQFGLSYGIANQVGKVSQTEAKEILKLASNSGIKILDTAIAYGDSEKSLGNLGIQNFQLVTKLPIVPIDCQDVGV